MSRSIAPLRRPVLLLALATLVLLLGVLSAAAAEVSREEFLARAEPVCRRNTQANEQILAGVRTEVRQGRLAPAGAAFARAAAALQRTLGKLEALPRPAADQARLAAWFADIATEVRLLEAVAAKLGKGERAAAERLSVKLTTAANRANAEALPFEFHWCRADPSKFT